ncbi:paired domain-containing protein [Trichonephila clavipes]|nr:paired domain-containing protein [Trichonephila clavipes]
MISARCRNIISATENDPNYLKSIVTGDETWCFQYDPEAKRRSAEWKSEIHHIFFKMAPKTKEISLDMRKHITELHKEEKSFREIGKFLKLSFTTVGYIVKNYLENGRVENKPRRGGSSKLISRAKRMVVRSATNKPMTSA